MKRNNSDSDSDEPKTKYPRIKNKCSSIICDHRYHNRNWLQINFIPETMEITTLDDLIKLADFYHCKMRITYNDINMEMLYNLKPHLIELQEMIGLVKIKETILDFLIYFLITKNINKYKKTPTMLHSVITGPPGCGKTTFIEILAKIYNCLGILNKGHIVKVKRSDLIGRYTGHTAPATQKKINEAIGGILLIDEAYSLGNSEQRDIFSKECIDTINQNLSELKGQFICVIAGYKDALSKSFFKYNEGLERRFPYKFDIERYSSNELTKILMKKIKENNDFNIEWNIKELEQIIEKYYNDFPNQGGDMELLMYHINICNNRRVFMLPKIEKDKLIINDILTAINKFKLIKNIGKAELPDFVKHLYV